MDGWLCEETSREMSLGFCQDSLLFLVRLVINSSRHRADAVPPLSRAHTEHPRGPVALVRLFPLPHKTKSLPKVAILPRRRAGEYYGLQTPDP